MVQEQNRHIDQGNRIKHPEVNPCIPGQSMTKGSNTIQQRKDSLFNKRCWENQTAISERMKLEHFLTPYTKISL